MARIRTRTLCTHVRLVHARTIFGTFVSRQPFDGSEQYATDLSRLNRPCSNAVRYRRESGAYRDEIPQPLSPVSRNIRAFSYDRPYSVAFTTADAGN